MSVNINIKTAAVTNIENQTLKMEFLQLKEIIFNYSIIILFFLKGYFKI